MTDTTTRAELIKEALYWDAVAQAAAARARQARTGIEEAAMAEYRQEGIAPSWRTEDAVVPLALSKASCIVADQAKLFAWVSDHHPEQLEPADIVIRPAFLKALLDGAAKRGDACDPNGLVIDGVQYRPGGEPKGISIRATPEAKTLLGEIAEETLDDVWSRVHIARSTT